MPNIDLFSSNNETNVPVDLPNFDEFSDTENGKQTEQGRN
jgi:hypothetical protein